MKTRIGIGCAILVSAITASANAEFIAYTFDSPGGGSGWGAPNENLSISSEHLHWWGEGYGTEGVLFAWDMDASEHAAGTITFDAAEGWEIRIVSFDVSGYGTPFNEVSLDVSANGESVFDTILGVNGNSTIHNVALDTSFASSFSIKMEDLAISMNSGMDNVVIEMQQIVPAPGAVALLGLAGLAARRRRRN